MALLDAGYGHDSKLRTGITELGKRYVGNYSRRVGWSRAGCLGRG
jgi:hypothetical protein